MKFIAIGDLHIRSTIPENRIDDYLKAQEGKVEWLKALQSRYDAYILSPGDVFDVPNPPIELINWSIDNLPHLICAPGNHDLPRHSLKLIDKSGVGNLSRHHKFEVARDSSHISRKNGVDIHAVPFGKKIINPDKDPYEQKILLTHVMVTKESTFWANGYIAENMLDEFYNYDYIITGDNHNSFVVEKDGRYLINCGSFMRMTIAQKSHKPVVYIIDTDAGTVIPEYVPIAENVFRDKMETHVEEDMDALVESISDDVELSLSFSKSIEYKIKDESNKIKQIVRECLEC